MKTARNEALDTRALSSFGIEVTASTCTDVAALNAEWLERLALKHGVVVLRGFTPLDVERFTAFARRFGELLQWNFGFVLDLVVHERPKNYLFTQGNVPYHWDGAFAAVVPRFQLFQCLQAPEPGCGETVFCNTAAVYARASTDERAAWKRIAIEYRTEREAHYGGVKYQPLLDRHAVTGRTTIRFAEPLNDDSVNLNPVFLKVFDKEDGWLDDAQTRAFLADFIPRLYEPEVVYIHTWRPGDFLLADNHALLHGRRPFFKSPRRHIQRIHII